MADKLPTFSDAQGKFPIEPRAKVLATSAAFALLLFAHSFLILSAALAFIIGTISLSKIDPRWVVGRIGLLLLGLLPFLLTMPFLFDSGRTLFTWGRLRITSDGLTFTLVLLLRSLAITLWVLYLLATTLWTDGIVAARRLGLPRKLCALLILSHRHIYLFDGELTRLRLAVRLRGFRNRMNRHSQRTVGQLIGNLFVRGLHRSEHLHQALLVRGFAGDLPSLHRPCLRSCDSIFLAVAILFHSALLAFDCLS